MMNVLFLTVFFLFSSCALKVRPKNVQETALAIEGERSNQVSLFWGSDRNTVPLVRAFEATERGFSLVAPLTIPVDFPDLLTIALPSGFSINAKKLRARIQEVKSEEIIGPAMILKITQEGSSIQITGLQDFFRQIEGQQSLLKIEEVGADGKVNGSKIEIPINKLNLKITTEISLPTGSEFRKLLSSSSRLDLLEQLTLKNEGSIQVEIKIGNTVSGNLYKDFTAYRYEQQNCKVRTWQESWTETYPVDLRLLPFDDQLSEDWTRGLDVEEHTLIIAPGESGVVGVFGFGESVRSFVDQGSRNSNPRDVEVVVRCETPNPNEGKDPRFPKDDFWTARAEPVYGNVPAGVRAQGVDLNLGGIEIGVRNVALVDLDPVSGVVVVASSVRRVFE